MEWLQSDGLEWLETSLPGARVCFTTRVGGISRAPFDSLNLGILTDDQRQAVLENRRRLSVAIGIDDSRIAMGRQVHGSELAFHTGDQVAAHYMNPGEPLLEVDGHITSASELALLVLVADCLPVAMSGPGGIAMLHCGWRGLAGSIIEDAAARIGATDAAIGPGIGPCCFEVGQEIFEAFPDLGPEVRHGGRLDLWKVAALKLAAAGVARIELAGICTSCNPDRFFSHRRDNGRTGRQAGIAWKQ